MTITMTQYVDISEFIKQNYNGTGGWSGLTEDAKKALWEQGNGIYSFYDMINQLDDNKLPNLNGGMVEFSRKDKKISKRKFIFKFNSYAYVYIEDTIIKSAHQYFNDIGVNKPHDFIRLDNFELDDFVLDIIRNKQRDEVDCAKIEADDITSQINRLELQLQELKSKHAKCRYFDEVGKLNNLVLAK